LIIEGNRLENVGTEIIDTHAGECFGVGGVLTGAMLTITGNELRNTGRNRDGTGPGAFAASILLIDNGGGAPFVGGNAIDNSASVGIWDVTAVAPAPAVRIIGNTIDNCPTGIDTGSWGAPKSGAIIRSNRIRQDGSFGSGEACIRQSNAHSCYIGLNEFSGAFAEGVRLQAGRYDLILWNDARTLSTPVEGATYFLDEESCGNSIRAHSGTVVTGGTCENDVAIDPAK
jgi:hypothetical protein